MSDLITEARVTKINELAAAVLADSQRRHRREATDSPGAGARLDLSASELRTYSWTAAIQSALGNNQDSFEQECSDEIRKRIQLPISSGLAIPEDVVEHRASNYLVGASAPAELSFMDVLRQRSVIFRRGAQLITNLQDDVAIPRQVSDATLQWLSPTGSATASDALMGQLSGIPKRAAVITEVSEQLLRQSSADRILQAALASVLAVGIDAAALNGAGGVQPLGILNTTGIGTLSGTGLAYAGIVGVQKTVADATAIQNPDALTYLFTPTNAEQLKNRQRFTSADSSLWRGAIHEGEVEGVIAVATKNMPANTGLYGDMSTVSVCQWGPLLLSADRGGTRFNLGQVGIRAQMFCDVIVTSPTSWVKITSIT
jgi:HK97 family phage major capsid protein